MRDFLASSGADLRFALRTFRRSPAFTLTALIAIALGVGAATAVFSAVDRVLFRALPYALADRLVSFGMLARVVDGGEFLFASDYKELSQTGGPFVSTASWSGVSDCDLTGGTALRLRCAEVDAKFVPVLGVRPILGASFTEADVQPGAPRRVLLSYGIWRSRFGGNPGVVGTTLLIDGAAARITAVLPANFELPTLEHADLFTPQVILPAAWQPGATRVLRVIGRLSRGTTLSAARAELEPAFAHMLSSVPPAFRKEVRFRVRSLRNRQMENAETASWTLFAAVLAVLLISCANVANLLLAKGAYRRTELAVRAALGAGRGRLVRQLICESLLLSTGGAILGVALAAALLRLLIVMAPHSVPLLESASLDRRALLFALLASLASGLLFGILPALARPRLEDLKSARAATQRSGALLQNLLVAGQLAFSTVLLASAGLLVRSLWNVEMQPLGLEPEHVLTAQMILPVSRFTKPAERIAFFNQVEESLASIPGLRAFGLSDSLPPGGWERSRPLSAIAAIGYYAHLGGTGGLVTWRYVSPGYFDALHIPILAGRRFTESDRLRNANICLISRSLADRLFGPGAAALGRSLKSGSEIVGIVPDVRNSGLLSAEEPEYYVLRGRTPDDTYLNSTGPVAQRTLSLVLRSALPDSKLANLVRHRIGALDERLPIEFQTMPGRLRDLAEAPRFHALLLVGFALVGLLLAAIGLYGTVSQLAAQRTREIGVRMALGAAPAAIATLVMREALKWTALGAAAGLLLSFLAARLLSSLLFRVPAHDGGTLAAALVFLLAAVFTAALGPARTAAQVDPVRALRSDG